MTRRSFSPEGLARSTRSMPSSSPSAIEKNFGVATPSAEEVAREAFVSVNTIVAYVTARRGLGATERSATSCTASEMTFNRRQDVAKSQFPFLARLLLRLACSFTSSALFISRKTPNYERVPYRPRQVRPWPQGIDSRQLESSRWPETHPTATKRDWWLATFKAVQSMIVERMIATAAVHHSKNVKRRLLPFARVSDGASFLQQPLQCRGQ